MARIEWKKRPFKPGDGNAAWSGNYGQYLFMISGKVGPVQRFKLVCNGDLIDDSPPTLSRAKEAAELWLAERVDGQGD